MGSRRLSVPFGHSSRPATAAGNSCHGLGRELDYRDRLKNAVLQHQTRDLLRDERMWSWLKRRAVPVFWNRCGVCVKGILLGTEEDRSVFVLSPFGTVYVFQRPPKALYAALEPVPPGVLVQVECWGRRKFDVTWRWRRPQG
jgi:hypothetical protein